VNLEPKKMVGEVSEGMVFDAGYSNETSCIISTLTNHSNSNSTEA
jgi:tRNA-binding EMAP/Myf-like protein